MEMTVSRGQSFQWIHWSIWKLALCITDKVMAKFSSPQCLYLKTASIWMSCHARQLQVICNMTSYLTNALTTTRQWTVSLQTVQLWQSAFLRSSQPNCMNYSKLYFHVAATAEYTMPWSIQRSPLQLEHLTLPGVLPHSDQTKTTESVSVVTKNSKFRN